MKTSTKNVIIGCILTAILTIPTASGLTIKILNQKQSQNQKQDQNQEQNQSQNQEQNQTLIVNIDGELISVDSKYVEEQEERINKLEDRIEQLINDTKNEPISASKDNNNIDITNEIYLNNLEVYNFQRVSGGRWHSENISEWNSLEDKTASGESYKNAVKMRTHLSNADSFVIDYYLKKEYTTFNGNFILDQKSKSTTSIATLKVYGDDTVIYEYDNITGGFRAQNTGDLDITNVDILRFEFTSKSGGVGDYDNFGVVFYDSILRKSQ